MKLFQEIIYLCVLHGIKQVLGVCWWHSPLRGLESGLMEGLEVFSLSCSSFFWKLIIEVSIASFWISVGGMTMLQSMKLATASIRSRALFA